MMLKCATLVLFALLACPAFADDTYQSTVSGTLTRQVAPQTPAEEPAKLLVTETLTLHVVHPSEAAEEKRTKDYRDYYDKWKDFPAQRPPKLPLPMLTRISYRACMAECLHGAPWTCPGGWPETK